MARIHLPTKQPFYDAARAFFELCLREDRSLFTPGAAIWTRANLDELHRRFNDDPDESGVPNVAAGVGDVRSRGARTIGPPTPWCCYANCLDALHPLD